MNRIRPWLYIGKYRDTLDKERLDLDGIGAMLQLADRVEQPGIVSLYLLVEDGQALPFDKLRQGVDFVQAQQAAGRTVLVACGAGVSRSATFSIAALKEDENVSLLQAYREILRAHPDALPHPALWQSLCRYYAEPVSLNALWQAAEKARREGNF